MAQVCAWAAILDLSSRFIGMISSLKCAARVQQLYNQVGPGPGPASAAGSLAARVEQSTVKVVPRKESQTYSRSATEEHRDSAWQSWSSRRGAQDTKRPKPFRLSPEALREARGALYSEARFFFKSNQQQSASGSCDQQHSASG